MSAESDARMLAELRARRARGGSLVGGEGFDLLLRIADERDELARKLCEMPDERPVVDHAAYVVTTCPACGHSPHGIGMICWQSTTCGCRGIGGQ